jgi:uncharacterized protein (DUF58 family)
MIDNTIRSKIKKIKLHTSRIMQSTLSGDYSSAFKGSGLEFDQLREYQMGDDVRFIDWNSSAKMNKIMVKQFIEERDRTVILCIDVSGSTNYSSKQELRKDMVAQLGATISFVAQANKDKVGALFFSDKIEKWIPPNRGNLHVGKIIEHIFTLEPTSKKTDLSEALKFLVNLKKRNAIVFMLSDWIDNSPQFKKILKIASLEYDFVGIRLLDDCETHFPDVGLLEIEDPETGQHFMLDTRKTPGKKLSALNLILQTHQLEQKKLFDRYKVALLDLTVGHPFINPLIRFFHNRIRRQI